ncbi:MAG: hypothetical protein KC646_15295 [Candidatus Cloacimonetes bacterium]|nr:hypothetical protein [Candidatus Cloacimonadota bacterium]
MKKLVVSLVALLLVSQNSFALGSRTRAMGGAFIGLADDENAIFTNPAGLSQLNGSHYHLDVLLNSRNEYTNDSFVYSSQIYEKEGTKRFSIEDYLENEFQFEKVTKKKSRFNYAISVNRDEKSADFVRKIKNDTQSNVQLNQTVSAPIETMTYNLGFATKFPMAPALFQKNQVYGGVSLKYQTVKREIASLKQSNYKDVLNVSFSALIKTPHNFSFGIVADALISDKVNGGTGTQSSSSNLSIGGSYRVDKGSVVNIDVTNVLNADRAVNPQLKLGFERELIKDELALRLGSWDGTFTMGFGMKLYEAMKVDYAFFNGDVLKEHYISTSLPF